MIRGRHTRRVPRCGRYMPEAHEPCARAAGHQDCCRTQYALDNAYVMRMGRARARGSWDNKGAGDGCESVPYALTPVYRPSPDEPGSSASIEVMAR